MGGHGAGRAPASWFGLASIVASALSLSPGVRAQSLPAPLVPVVVPLRADSLLDSARGPRVGAVFTPLRLSLLGGLFPVGSWFPGCDSRAEASGNSVSGFAIQRYTFLPLGSRLTLHGFANDGCPVDAGLGGGMTYLIPFTKSLWLVPSAGFYAQPALGAGSAAQVSSSARIDLVKQLASGRTLSFGLGTRTRGGAAQFNAFSFGGSF